jgi:glycosyltransferase involved in cell wall biosynthesis
MVSHPYSTGNGAAIKTGARNAKGDILVFMDADGQHSIEDLDRLVARFNQGFDMVVGARSGPSQAGKRRRFGNQLYNRLASLITGHHIDDLTSGFRVVHADKFREFLHLLPNGFSYPTTITMAFFRSGYSVAYVPIHAKQRSGKSHIRLARDGLRFLLIIFRVGTLYSPLKVFVPVSGLFFLLGLGYYAFTYITQGRFTNMSALLLVTSVIVFMIGLVSEQITNLMYTK